MLIHLEQAIKTSIIPTVQKQLVTVQALTSKILTVALRILKAFSDLLLYVPRRIFNRNIQQTLPITSFPNQDGIVLDQDLLSLALTYVANPSLESVSKGVAKASLQSYRLIFEELEKEQEGFLSLLVKQAIIDHPIKSDEAAEEVFKKRLKQVYSTVMTNAKNWPEHAEIFAETKKSYGPLNPNRLREIAEWTTDQHLIYVFKIVAEDNLQTRQLLVILNSSLPVKEKACAMRQWLCEHPDAFEDLRSLDLGGSEQKPRLTEIPEEIGYLINLTLLSFDLNAIQFVPDFIGQLTQLSQLYLSQNQLQTLPNSIGQLTQLRQLWLSQNQLKELPDSIGKLTQLQYLDLRRNPLKELPDSMGKLTQLQYLDLRRTPLKRLPNSLRELRRSRKVFYEENLLKRIFTSIFGPI